MLTFASRRGVRRPVRIAARGPRGPAQKRAAMRLCASSRSFELAFAERRLTQLEWIDLCCSLPDIAGVDLGVEHFPRRDADYLAQIKKLCVDRCLTIAAVNTALPFGAGDIDAQIVELAAMLDLAADLGAPLARFSCGAALGSPGIAWHELIRGLKAATHHAKERNVTLALQPRADSLVAAAPDVKRALKECDSAWLRLALPASAEWEPLLADAVIATLGVSGAELAFAVRFRGFLSLEDESGSTDAARLRRWVEGLTTHEQ